MMREFMREHVKLLEELVEAIYDPDSLTSDPACYMSELATDLASRLEAHLAHLQAIFPQND